MFPNTASSGGTLYNGVMTKRAAPELKAAIRRYHRDGWSYYALAKIVPYTDAAIAKWCDEGLRQRQRQVTDKWHEKNPGANAANTAKWAKKNTDYVKAKRKERYAREKQLIQTSIASITPVKEMPYTKIGLSEGIRILV